MAPKSEHRNRTLEWSNFLLGCVNCNSVKGNRVVSDEDVLWPDRHNTMLAIEYLPGGFIRTSGELDDRLSRRARGLVNLVGLDRHDARGWPSPTDRDRRWSQREEVWKAAEYSRSLFERLGESEGGNRTRTRSGHGPWVLFGLDGRVPPACLSETGADRGIPGNRGLVLQRRGRSRQSSVRRSVGTLGRSAAKAVAGAGRPRCAAPFAGLPLGLQRSRSPVASCAWGAIAFVGYLPPRGDSLAAASRRR